MQCERFRDQLEEAVKKIDLELDVEEEPQMLLNWTLGRALLGDEVSPARSILSRQRHRKDVTKNTRSDVEDWAALAASALLLGEPWQREADLCWNRLEPAIESYGSDRRLLDPAIGLAMLLQDGEAVARWRSLRLAEALLEEAEVVGFEVLYLSSPYVAVVPVTSLSIAIARVAAQIVKNPLFVSAASHLFMLAALGSTDGQTLPSLLTGVIDELDQVAFGSPEQPSCLSWDDAAFQWGHRESAPVCEMSLAITGTGVLSSGAHALEPITYLLPKNVAGLLQRASEVGPADSVLRSALLTDQGRLEVVLALADGIELAYQERVGFEGRLAVAWEHASKRIRELRSSVSLSVRQT